MLFRGLRPSSISGFPFWRLGLTGQSSRPAYGGRLTFGVSGYGIVRVKKKTFSQSGQFAKVLADDVFQAKQRMENSPTESHRREFIRATHAAIEAQSWQLKMYVIEHVLDKKTASHHEVSALKEESYAINNKGEIHIQPRGYSLKVSLRVVFAILKKYGVPIQVDFGSSEWENIDRAVNIRNRVTHPKNMTDISVSIEDAECCYQAFVYIHTILLNTILGTAVAVLNAVPTAKRRRSFFSSAQ